MSISTHAIATEVTTFGGTDGTITVDICNGGIGDLHFQWYKKDANGIWQPFSTEKNLINLSAGYYYGTVTDSSTPPQMGFFGADGAPMGPLFNQPPQSSGMFVVITPSGQRVIVDLTTAGNNVTIPTGKAIPIPQNLFTSAKLYMNGSLIETFDEPFEAWILNQS